MRYLPRGDAEDGHPHSKGKLARRNGDTSAAGPRGVIRDKQDKAGLKLDKYVYFNTSR